MAVCRLRSKMGSHIVKLLTCATNRNLSNRRDRTQTAMIVGESGAAACNEDPSCILTNTFQPLNGVLAGQPFHVLRMPVNAGALQALLAKVPLPEKPDIESPAGPGIPRTASRNPRDPGAVRRTPGSG